MPAIGFKYPDGEEITFKEVFEDNKIDIFRMGITIPMLKELSKQRDPNRKPSVTECLSGTCEAYLKRTEDYFIDPQEHAFALAGTLHHKKLEDNAEKDYAEIFMESLGITGIADLYDEKTKTLIDYKNSGSYKVAKVLGVQHFYADHPEGEVYKRKTKWGNAGTVKRVKQFYLDEEKADFGDWGWQLNCYRYMLESSGKEIKDMYIQITVRDGGIQMARDRGIDRKIYLIKVPYIHNDHIVKKFTEKRDRLLESLDKKIIPAPCDEEETWGGKKCEMFCDVRNACPYV
jgi:hypothetical protein